MRHSRASPRGLPGRDPEAPLCVFAHRVPVTREEAVGGVQLERSRLDCVRSPTTARPAQLLMSVAASEEPVNQRHESDHRARPLRAQRQRVQDLDQRRPALVEPPSASQRRRERPEQPKRRPKPASSGSRLNAASNSARRRWSDAAAASPAAIEVAHRVLVAATPSARRDGREQGAGPPTGEHPPRARMPPTRHAAPANAYTARRTIG